ncbi:MAG: hypothetical protein SP1CHLAM9_08400 [Chlamydiia bacterium]|nr:hypothetical protein [Chlamydiia bacterium]
MNKYVSVFCLLTNIALMGEISSNAPFQKICTHCDRGVSNARVDVVKRSRPAVVYIETKQENTRSRGFVLDPFEHFFGAPKQEKWRQRENFSPSGSGFIVSENGYIITNNHVIEGASEIKVEITKDGKEKEYQAELVGCDPRTDIAILKIEEKDLPYLEFGDSDAVEEGQSTVAIGHPFRLRHTITGGLISAKERTHLDHADRADYIQTDAALNPGSSGGPLLDLEGKVIAVNTAIRERSNGLGFAIPSNIAKMVYEHVKATGSVDRGFLGVSLQDLSEDLIDAFGYEKNTKGALVTSVEEGFAGALSGLETGDLITSFNGTIIKDAKTLVIAVGKLPAGKKYKMKVLRGAKNISLKGELGSQTASLSNSDILQKIGIVLDRNSKGSEDKGVVIKEIIPGSLAYRSGWKARSTIISLNGDKISSVEDLLKALEKSEKEKKLVALLDHNGARLFTSITIP